MTNREQYERKLMEVLNDKYGKFLKHGQSVPVQIEKDILTYANLLINA